MKQNIKILIIIASVVLSAIMGFSFKMDDGGAVRSDVDLADYAVSEGGTEITLHTRLLSRTGHIRGFEEHDSEGKARYLTFYNTYGNAYGRLLGKAASAMGAKTEFVLKLEPDDTEIYFNRPDGKYELILKKDEATGKWVPLKKLVQKG